MIPIFNINRGLWKQKPQQWGNFSDVQSALFHNAERIGIDPADITLAMPMWGPGDQTSYGAIDLIGANSNVNYERNALDFPATNSNILVPYNPGLATSDLTLFAFLNTSSASSQQIMAREGGTTTRIFQFKVDATTGYLNFITVVPTDTDNIGVTPVNDGSDHAVAAVMKGNSFISLFVDGAVDYYESESITLGTNSASLAIGNENRNFEQNWQGAYHQALYFSTCLTECQISLLSDNPYALWQPRTPTFYSFPSVSSGYRIRYGTGTDPEDYQTAEVTDTEYIQTGLDPSTLYMAQVQAYEGDEDSAWTDWENVYTLPSGIVIYRRRIEGV